MVAAIAATVEPDALAGGLGEGANHLRGDRLGSAAVEHGLRPLGIGPGLIAKHFEAIDPVLERRVVEIGDACFNGVVETLQAQLGLGGALVEFGDVFAAALALLLPPVEDGGENGFQPFGLQQALFQMVGDKIVELLHRHRHAGAGGWSLPRFHRTGIIAVAPALAGADGHRPAASGAMDEAGEHRRPTDDAGGHDLGIACLEQCLHRVERFCVDDRRDRHGDDFGLGLQFLGLAAFVELMLAHIGATGEDAVDLSDAPTPAVAGEDAAAVEIGDDVLDPHLAGRAVTLQREPVDQPDSAGVERVDLQLLLDLHAPRLGGDGAIADGRKRAVPEALAGILLQRAHDVLGILLRLIFVEQRHDPPHHVVHRIVTKLLRDGDEPDAVLAQLAVVIFHLEGIAEEATERVDHDDIERRGLRRTRLDHPLELGAAVIGGGVARLDEGFGKLVAAREAVGLALPFLIGDGNIMLGLPRCRDAQIEGGAQRDGHGRLLGIRSWGSAEQVIEQVAEPALECGDFGFGNGHGIRPVVGDGPCTKFMLWRSAGKGPGLAKQRLKLLGCGWRGRAVGLGHARRVV